MDNGTTRREFLTQLGLGGAGFAISPYLARRESSPVAPATPQQTISSSININGVEHQLLLATSVTLLDALRENLHLTGTKKGCDHGQCGACTVLLEGQRVNACLQLAALCDGKHVTTIEGLAKGEDLHPMQQAFLKHDAFQCGYCTPGQICSAVGLVNEAHAREDAEIREEMSGNICRCGAYQNILSAIREVQG